MAGYTYANTSLFTHYLLAKTDESIYVGRGEMSTDPNNKLKGFEKLSQDNLHK
jgi:hypothetical protein